MSASTRRALLLTSALIGCAALPSAGWGQVGPIVDPRQFPVITNTDQALVGKAGGRLTIDVNGSNRILTASSFNIGKGKEVLFKNGDAATQAQTFTAINRVVRAAGIADARSFINGALLSENVNVWLINPDGITFGAAGSFSGTSLVLSTIPVLGTGDRSVFSSNEVRFKTGGLVQPYTAPITFKAGSKSIHADGSIVVVAQAIDLQAGRTLEATQGSVALVAATDVTFTDGVDNPLSIRINAGTTIASAIKVDGAVAGQSIRIVGGANNAVQGALLGVTVGGTLTATGNADGSIVIATTKATKAAGGSVKFDKDAVSRSTIDVTGGLLGAPSNKDVIVKSTGSVKIDGTTTGRNVKFTAGDVLTASGTVTASGNYLATGASVMLGGATQSADARVAITARTGDITVSGTLKSGQNGAGTLTLDAAGAILASSSSLIAGKSGASSNLVLGSGGAIELGTVTAQALVGLGRDDGSLRAATDFTADKIDVVDALDIRANAGTITLTGSAMVGAAGKALSLRGETVTTGALTTNGGTISVTATKGATIAGASIGSDVTFEAGGMLTASGAVTASGAYTATGGRVTLGKAGKEVIQSADGAVTVTAEKGDIIGLGALALRSGQAGSRALKLDAAGAIAFAPTTSLVAGTLDTRADIMLASAGDIGLGTVTANMLTGVGAGERSLSVTGDFTSRTIALTGPLDLRATGEIAVTGGVTIAGSDADLSLSGSRVTIKRAIGTAGGDVLIAADRNVRVGAVSTRNAGATTGTIAIAAGRAVTGRGQFDAGEDIAVHAGGGATFAQLNAGDDVVIDVGRTLKLSGIETFGAIAAAGKTSVTFGTDPSGRPSVPIVAGADPDGSNIVLTATRILSKSELSGPIDTGLVVGVLEPGGANATLSATSGDIRIGSATRSGTLSVLADEGSITGLRDGEDWTNPSGGATLKSAGAVSLDAGKVRIGAIEATDNVSNSEGARSIRIGKVKGVDVDLSAKFGLQLGTVTATGDATLSTTGGSARVVKLVGETLARHYGDATLTADGGKLTVGNRSGGAAGGVAQLGGITGNGIDVLAQAVNINGPAKSTGGTLFVRADAGRLSVASAEATTSDIMLWKRGTVGTLRVDGVSSLLTAGTGIDVRSTTDATVTKAVTTGGNLAVQASGNLILNDGSADAGTLALLAGGRVASAVSLTAGQDVAIRAGDARLATVSAGDDVDFQVNGPLSLTGNVSATGAPGGDRSSVLFTPAGAGQSDPAGAFPNGGIAFRTTDPLTGSTIHIKAGSIAGGSTTGVQDTGLVLETLKATTATITAQTGDIRIGSAEATTGDLTVRTGGSISGLRPNWAAATGVTLDAVGDIRLDVSGSVTLGAVKGHDVTGSGGTQSVRIGTVDAHDVTLTASDALQLGTTILSGAATLETTAGSGPQPFVPAGPVLIADHDAAMLTAAGVLTVGGTTLESAAGGAAQLADIRGASIDVRAQAVTIGGIEGATATERSLFVRADAGRLAITSGTAATGDVTLWKRGTTGGLFAESLTAGTGIDVRSAADVTVTKAVTTDGNLAFQAAQALKLTEGMASGGTLALLAGGSVTSSGLLSARDDVSIHASAGQASLGNVQAGDDIDLFASGTLTFASLSARATGDGATRGVTFDPSLAGDSEQTAPTPSTKGGITFDRPDTLAGSSVRIAAGAVGRPSTDVGTGALVVGQLTGAGADVTALLGDIRLGGIASGGSANGFLKTSGDLTVTAQAGSVTGLADAWTDTSGSSRIEALGNAGRAISGTVAIETSGAVAVGTIGARGDVTVGSDAAAITPAGTIRIGAVDADNLKLTADTDLEVGTATLTGAATLKTTGGVAVGATDLAATPLANGYGRAALEASGGALTVSALSGVAQLGTIAGRIVDVRADALDITAATATGTSLFLLAERGRLTLGAGMAETTATLTKSDDDAVAGTPSTVSDALFVGSLSAGTGIDVDSATDATVTRAITTNGTLAVDATRNATLTDGTATTEALTLTAGASATSGGTLSAGTGIRVSAKNGAADLATLGAGTDIQVAAATDLKIGKATTASGNVLLSAGRDVDLGMTGAISAPGTITVTNTGEGQTAIGTGASGTFALSEEELGQLHAPDVVIDSQSKAIEIGTLAIGSATGGSSLRFLTTGAVTLSGAISGAGSGTLQIGGRDGAAPSGLVDGATLAKQIVADTGKADIDKVDIGASISFANGNVDLRAQRIVFGTKGETSIAPPFTDYIGLTPAEVARAVANANSAIYKANGTAETFLTAKTMTVSYTDFAIFQNTQPGFSAGVLINDAKTAQEFVLQLFSTGGNGSNSFALFGKINGLVGQAVALLPNKVLNISDENSANLRIARSDSRVNGCVIGAPEKGCVNTDLPAVQFRLYDERQTQLFTSSTDPSIYANPLIGRGNEGLIVDIADVPVGIDTIECPKDAPDCRKEGTPR